MLLEGHWCLPGSCSPDVGLSQSRMVEIRGVISSGEGQEVWAAPELQSQGRGMEKIHSGAAGERKEVVKPFTVTCFCILPLRAVRELKSPLEDKHGGNSAGKCNSCTSAACCMPAWKARAEWLPKAYGI